MNKKILSKLTTGLILAFCSSLRASCPTLVTVSGSPFGAGTAPVSLAYSPFINGVYYAAVVNSGSGGSVTPYSTNAITGALTQIGSPVSTGGLNPSWIAYSPAINGKYYAAVTNLGSNDLQVFQVGLNGSLTPVGSTVATGSGPTSIAYSPVINGNYYAAVANTTPDDTIDVFSINSSTGAFTQVGSAISSGGTGPTSISYSANINGNYYVVVVNKFSNALQVFLVNSSNGSLSAVGSPVSTGGNQPSSIAYSPAIGGNYYAAVANTSSNTVQVFSVNISTGALTAIGSAVSTAARPRSIVYSTDGSFAVVANDSSNSVNIFSINSQTGAFTVIGSSISVGGTDPLFIACSPDNNFVATANNVSNNVSVLKVFSSSTVPTLNSANVNTSGIVTVTGNNAVPNATITIIADSSTIIGSGTADGSGNYTFAATTPVSAGSHAIAVTQTVNGCTSNLSNAITVTLAAGAPLILVYATANIDGFVTVNGTGATPGATVSIVLNGNSIIGTGTADGSGNFAFVSSSMAPNGLSVITVTQAATITDLSNNKLIAVGVNKPTLFVVRLIEKYFV